jgi:hypothetical protein
MSSSHGRFSALMAVVLSEPIADWLYLVLEKSQPAIHKTLETLRRFKDIRETNH